MKKCDCELCKFENPKVCVTAVIIKNERILVLKRNEEPFKGEWDFAGGYVQKNETPDVALKREIKEELGVDCNLEFLGYFTGSSSYHDYEFPILNIVYYADLNGEIVLDENENSQYSWVLLKEIESIAFDSNQKVLDFVKNKFI